MINENQGNEIDDDMRAEYNFNGDRFIRGKYRFNPLERHTVEIYEADGSVTIYNWTFRAAKKNLSVVLDHAVRYGETRILDENGRVFIVRPKG